MGAVTFETLSFGTTADEAFTSAVEDAKHMHGHSGYTGTIAEKTSFTVIPEHEHKCRQKRYDDDAPQGRSERPREPGRPREYAHALLHFNVDDNTERSKREVEAEAVTYVVGRYFGLDMSGSAFYLASWSGDDPEAVSDRLHGLVTRLKS